MMATETQLHAIPMWLLREYLEELGGEAVEEDLYFTRSYRAREFEYFAPAELARRGLDKAETVVAVTDGAEWLQSFIDYHCPKAARIIDFAHAVGYVGEAGRAVWGEDTEAFASWFARTGQRETEEKT